jgi:murein hydrolase activator
MPVPPASATLPSQRRAALGSLFLIALCCVLLSGERAAHGQTQARAKPAAALAAEIRDGLRRIRQQLIETARETQAREAVVVQSEERLSLLKIRHAERARDLSGQRQRLASLTIAMQRLSRRPPEAILTSPRPPLETARAMMLVQYLVPSIKGETDLIRGELTELEALNHQIQNEQEQFLIAGRALEERRDQLDDLIERKNALWRVMSEKTRPTDAQTDQLAQSSATLADLLKALKKHGDDQADSANRLASLITLGPKIDKPPTSTTPAAPLPKRNPRLSSRPSDQTAVTPSPGTVPATGSFAANKGRLGFPAIGALVGRFGEIDKVGLTAKGITVQTRPNAPVVASHDGKVIYAGPFRGYGRIIIIEHGQGFLTLLAGLGRIDVQAGQGLLAGEPVGTMRGADRIGDARSRHLYIELRRNGAPVDPLAWLSTQRDTATQ